MRVPMHAACINRHLPPRAPELPQDAKRKTGYTAAEDGLFLRHVTEEKLTISGYSILLSSQKEVLYRVYPIGNVEDYPFW